MYRIYTFLGTGALWKRSYMAQNQLRHHITFSYFPSCDLDAIFSVECSWHTGDFAQNCWRNEHFFRSLSLQKNVFLHWKLRILTTNCLRRSAPMVRITTTQPSCGRSPFIRMQHTLSQLTMRPGGAGRLHLELVFLIKTLTQIQPGLLIKAPVSKNVYTVVALKFGQLLRLVSGW